MAFLASAAPVLAALGVGAQAVGSLESGFYSGQVAKNNAKIATQSANYAHQAGSEEAATEGRKVAAEEAAIKTATGAHGIDVNTGSAADVGVGARAGRRRVQQNRAGRAAAGQPIADGAPCFCAGIAPR